MEIKELKFNSVLDVACCFIETKNIKLFLIQIFEIAHNVIKKNDRKLSSYFSLF